MSESPPQDAPSHPVRAGTGTPGEVRRIPPNLRLQAAMRLVSRQTPNREGAARRLLASAPIHGIDLAHLWGTVESGSGRELVRQVVLAVPAAGRTLMVYLSEPDHVEVAGRSPGAVEERARILRAVCAWFEARAPGTPDVRLAQGLPDPRDTWAVNSLMAAGFTKIADLYYLRRPIRPMDASELRTLPERVRVVRVSELPNTPERDEILIRALSESYEGTLDCPELCGLRDTRDVLASHKAAGVWDPSWWWVVFDDNQPRGCLLLNRCPDQRTVELVYLGLGPTLRGRGIAGPLLEMGTAQVSRLPASDEMTCAVDRRNAPALKLYQRLGFRPMGERAALVRAVP